MLIHIKLATRWVIMLFVGVLLYKVVSVEFVNQIDSDSVAMAMQASITGLMAVIVRYHFKEGIDG